VRQIVTEVTLKIEEEARQCLSQTEEPNPS
jgi:hypothetical protein